MTNSRAEKHLRAKPPACRCPGMQECLLHDTAFDGFERDVLAVMRHVCLSMSPNGQGDHLQEAMALFPLDTAPFLAGAIAGYVQTMALNRSDRFRYSNPACAGCAVILTDCERHLLSVLYYTRRDAIGHAAAHAAMLCDKASSAPLIEAAAEVARWGPMPRLAQ